MENSDFKVGKSNIKVGMVEFLTLMSEIPNLFLVFKDYFIGDPIRLPYWTKIYVWEISKYTGLAIFVAAVHVWVHVNTPNLLLLYSLLRDTALVH